MKRIRLEIELLYDDEIMHHDDPEAIEWFNNRILTDDRGELLLHSNEIGDTLGSVKVLKRLESPKAMK